MSEINFTEVAHSSSACSSCFATPQLILLPKYRGPRLLGVFRHILYIVMRLFTNKFVTFVYLFYVIILWGFSSSLYKIPAVKALPLVPDIEIEKNLWACSFCASKCAWQENMNIT